MIDIDIGKLVGKGYGKFWFDKSRYRVLKGGRASKKSVTTALWFIYNMMKYPGSNTLVVRKTYNTHRDSTFAGLKWAIKQMKVDKLWKCTLQPMEMIYQPTGQKILFRGFDDVMKITSITVDTGHLCWAWLEETFEIENEEDFRTLDESIRGELPENLWHQITLTYNPWINNHWTKKRFFDNEDPNASTFTTTHWDNEFLSDSDHKLIEDLKEKDPERYLVVGLGEYGIPGGAYFDEFRKSIHVVEPFKIPDFWDKYISIDYGLDMFACLWFAIDTKGTIYVYKEIAQSNLIVSEAAQKLIEYNTDETMNYAPPDLWNRRNDTGRSAIDIFNEHGVFFTKSSNNRVDGWLAVKELLKPYKRRDEQTGEYKETATLQIFPNCKNLIASLPQLTISDKNPNDVSNTPHDITHTPDALRGFAIMRYSPSYRQKDTLELPPEIEEMYLRRGGTSFYD